MYIKYEVPKNRRHIYEGKELLYGKVIQQISLKNTGITLIKVQYINYYNIVDVLDVQEISKINLLDKIKIFFMKRR